MLEALQVKVKVLCEPCTPVSLRYVSPTLVVMSNSVYPDPKAAPQQPALASIALPPAPSSDPVPPLSASDEILLEESQQEMEAVVSAEGDTCAVIMFDIESTGLNRQLARMWQLAARCGSSTFERFVAPDNWQWEPVAQDMFRRSGVDLSHAPPLATVLAEFNDWVRTCFGKMKLFVAWNSSYDRDILHHEFVRAKVFDGLPEQWVFVDGIQLCKRVDSQPGSWALTAVRSVFMVSLLP